MPKTMCGFIDAQRPAENGVTPRGPISTVVSLNCKKKLPNFLPYRGNAKAWLEKIGKANSRKRRQDLKKIGLRSIIFLAPRHKFGGEGVAVR
jgi:hypothetical protein